MWHHVIVGTMNIIRESHDSILYLAERHTMRHFYFSFCPQSLNFEKKYEQF